MRWNASALGLLRYAGKICINGKQLEAACEKGLISFERKPM